MSKSNRRKPGTLYWYHDSSPPDPFNIEMLIETRRLPEIKETVVNGRCVKYEHVLLGKNGKKFWIKTVTKRIENDPFWKAVYERIDL